MRTCRPRNETALLTELLDAFEALKSAEEHIRTIEAAIALVDSGEYEFVPDESAT